MKKVINESAGTIDFTFEGADGKTDPTLTVTFHAAKMAESNRAYGLLHGMAARIGDGAALSRKGPNGTVLTITEGMRRAEVQSYVTHYESGATEWNLKATAKPAAQNPAIVAIAAKLGKSYEEALAWYNAKLMAELDAMGAPEAPADSTPAEG